MSIKRLPNHHHIGIIRQPFCPVVTLVEGIRMPSPNYPVLCCPLPYHVASVFVVVSPLLGWSPLSSFLVVMVSNWWHARSIGRLWGGWYALPRTISFFSQCWLYIICYMTFVFSLTQMLVFLSLYVMLSILLSILVSVWPHVCHVLVWSVSMSLHHMP